THAVLHVTNSKVRFFFSTKNARNTENATKIAAANQPTFLIQSGKGKNSEMNVKKRRRVKPSNRRSTTMVARVELLLKPSFWPRKYDLTSSPSRAGRTLFAMQPIATPEKTLTMPMGRIGFSTYFHR